MAKSAPTPVTCPGLCGPSGAPACGGETVSAHGVGSKTRKTVTVDPCSKLLAQGWKGPQLAVRMQDAAALVAGTYRA